MSHRSRFEISGGILTILTNGSNLLGADVVTIYGCNAREFKKQPQIAGRLVKPEIMELRLREGSPPEALLAEKEPIFAKNAAAHAVLNPESVPNSFVERDHIKSCAVLRLERSGRIAGMMFVNYRESHDFTGDERENLKLLASSAGIALGNWNTHAPEDDEKADAAVSDFLMHSLSGRSTWATS